METEEPTIFENHITMKYIKDSSYHSARKTVDQWELVTVKITIE